MTAGGLQRPRRALDASSIFWKWYVWCASSIWPSPSVPTVSSGQDHVSRTGRTGRGSPGCLPRRRSTGDLRGRARREVLPGYWTTFACLNEAKSELGSLTPALGIEFVALKSNIDELGRLDRVGVTARRIPRPGQQRLGLHRRDARRDPLRLRAAPSLQRRQLAGQGRRLGHVGHSGSAPNALGCRAALPFRARPGGGRDLGRLA